MYTVYSKKSSNWECENILPTKVSKFNIVENNFFLCVLFHYRGHASVGGRGGEAASPVELCTLGLDVTGQ